MKKRHLQRALLSGVLLLFGVGQSFAQCPAPEIAPWTETFTVTTNPPCWTQSATTGGPWVYSGTPDIGTTATIVDHTSGVANNYAWIDFSATDAGVILTSPEVNISALTTPTLSFWLFSHNNSGTVVDYNELYVEAWDGAAWQPVEMISGELGFGWSQFYFDLSSFVYSTNLVQVRFRAESGGDVDDYDNDLMLDDVGFVEMPACFYPTAVEASPVSDVQATIEWNQAGNATSWNIEWGAPGFVPGTGAQIGAMTTSTNPQIISGLTPTTDYDVYVLADCDVNWSDVHSFTTTCAVVTPDYTQPFNTFVPDACWTEADAGDPTTGPSSLGAGTWLAGTALGNTARINLLGTAKRDWVLSPYFDLSAGGYEVLIDVAVTNVGSAAADAMGSDDEVQLLYSEDGITWNNLETWTVADPITEVLTTYALSVPSTGSNVQFGIFASDGTVDDAESYDFHIDNFIVQTPPACPPVTVTTLDQAGINTADISWTNGGSETSWNIQWGAPGFVPGTGAEIGSSTSSTNPTQVTGLSAQTTYDIYIQSDCGGGDLSTWSGPISVTTLCDIFVAPFLEEFSAGVQPSCWDNTSSNTVANGLWKFAGNGDYGAAANGEPAGTFAWSDGSTPEVADVTLTTPMIDVSTLTTPMLMFEWFSNNENAPGDNVPLEVQINNGTGWTTLGTFSGDNTAWQEVELVLYAYVDDTIQVRFITDQTVPTGSAFYNDILLDDVAIVEAPSCPRPSAIVASNPTSSSAQIDWTTQGFETEWVLEYGPVGFTPGTGTSVVTTTNPHTLTPLDDNTSYDIYVRAICSAGDTSDYRGTATITTLCLPFVAQAWCEDFSSTSPSQACWTVLNENGDTDSWDMDYGTNPFAGDQAASILTNLNAGNNDDYLITPQLILTGNEIMTFYYRVQSATDMNDFEILLSTTGIAPADFQDTILAMDSYGNITYEDTSVNLSAFTGNVYIAFHVPSGGLDGNRLYIDQVCVDICNPTPSIDGVVDVCRLDDTLDVNTVITPGENNGVWTFDSNPGALNGSVLNISTLADDTYNLQYVVTTACTADTAYATVSVHGPSSAGENGVLEACSNQLINLLSGLSGNVDLGGTWTDPSGNVLSSSYFLTGQLPGQFNYNYVTSNGICPNDSSSVILNILPCDWLGLDENALEGIVVYPNPSSGTFYISNMENGQNFAFEVLDLNGRKVVAETMEVITATETEVNLTNLENGIYLIRLFNKDGEKMVRIVKQ